MTSIEPENLTQQREKEYQEKLMKFEKSANKYMFAGKFYDTHYVRKQLLKTQRTLKLSDSDVAPIKTKYQQQNEQENSPDPWIIPEKPVSLIYRKLKDFIVVCILIFSSIIFFALLFSKDSVKSEKVPVIDKPTDRPIYIASTDLIDTPDNSESLPSQSILNDDKPNIDKQTDTAAEVRPQPPITPPKPPGNINPVVKSEMEGTTWLEDRENSTELKITTESCIVKDFLNEGYKFFASSSIPKAKLKKTKDAYFVSNSRATTVYGCWFQKAGSLIHVKWERKHDRKIWEQDLNLENEGIWSNQIDGNGKKRLKDDINERINIVWNRTTKEIRAALRPEQKKWLKERENNCTLKTPTGESVSVSRQKACMAIMTDERTNVLKQQITAMEK